MSTRMRRKISCNEGAAAERQTALRTMQTAATGLAIALAMLSLPARAQSSTSTATSMTDMPGMHAHTSSPAAPDAASETPAVKAFKAADHHMMEQMSAGYTGDTDQDFVTHMLPHHEGAVEMAKIQLQHGKDPALKQLAREIIKAQDKEIQFMKAWQAKHPPKQ